MSKFSDATLYLAPSGYKEGILFPQKPLSTNGEISFTRTSSAWRTNIEGQVEEVCYNLAQYSEEFDNAYWTKALGTLTSNVINAPNGTLTADLFTKTSAVNTVSQVSRSGSVYLQTGIHTLSVYAKQNVGNLLLLRLDNNDNTANAQWNFSTKSFTNIGANIISSSFEELSNGWFRLIVTGNVTSTTWSISIANLFANPTNDSVYIWGAQLVKGSLPKPYLSTTNRQNFPRVDYSLGTGTFLLEPQRTNLMLNSGDFQNASWGKSTLTFNSTETAPDGTSSARNYSTAGAFSYALQVVSVVSGQYYTSSCYLKYTSGVGSLAVRFTDGTSVNFISVTANLINGTIGSVSYGGNGANGTATITSVGDGWYRVTVSGTLTIANAGFIVSNLGLGATTFSVWGGQVELGAYPSTYIPTTSSAVTRLADSFSRGNIFTNNLISSSGGTWFVELQNNLAYTRDAGNQNLWVGDSSTAPSNSFEIRNGGAANALLTIGKRISNTFTGLYNTTTSTVKIAVKWNGTSADVFVNGTKQISATAFSITNMEFLAAKTEDVPKYIQQMALWRTPLTDAQCQELTL